MSFILLQIKVEKKHSQLQKLQNTKAWSDKVTGIHIEGKKGTYLEVLGECLPMCLITVISSNSDK